MNKLIVLILMFGMSLLVGCSSSETVMTADTESLNTGVSNFEDTTEIASATETATFFYVYVCGYVEQPGVYPLKPGARICDALELAGGVTADGKPEALDQAQRVEDGQTIYVPGRYEDVENVDVDDGLVDINKADKAMLMTLPGIGESKAEMILQYREEHGNFEAVEDLMNIPGIKEGVYNKIKDSIKVS